MTDNDFLKAIYEYAEELKKSLLTQKEKDAILNEFNQNKVGTPAERAYSAVHKIIKNEKVHLVEGQLSKSANLDNTLRLLNDLKQAASQWSKGKK